MTFMKTRVLRDLIQLFADHKTLLEAKGAFVLRRLCLLLDARVIYLAMARNLADHPNREFAALLVELLNLILLTSVEMTDLRDLLRGCAALDAAPAAAADGSGSEDAYGEPVDSMSVFLVLFKTWCMNPVAAVALCLLAQAYDLAARLVTRFAETTISVGVLMQLDKLVQLLETPIFVSTRLHMTQPERPDHTHLLRALYGVLMMLPQGTAFATLRDRLHSVSALHSALHGTGSVPPPLTSRIDVDAAYAMFADFQRRQREALTADLRARSVLHRWAPLDATAPAAASAAAASAAAASSAAVAPPASSSPVGGTTDGSGGDVRSRGSSGVAASSIGVAAAARGLDGDGVGDGDGDVDGDDGGAPATGSSLRTPLRDALRGGGGGGGGSGGGGGGAAGAPPVAVTFPSPAAAAADDASSSDDDGGGR